MRRYIFRAHFVKHVYKIITTLMDLEPVYKIINALMDLVNAFHNETSSWTGRHNAGTIRCHIFHIFTILPCSISYRTWNASYETVECVFDKLSHFISNRKQKTSTWTIKPARIWDDSSKLGILSLFQQKELLTLTDSFVEAWAAELLALLTQEKL